MYFSQRPVINVKASFVLPSYFSLEPERPHTSPTVHFVNIFRHVIVNFDP